MITKDVCGVGGFATQLAARRGHRVLAVATHGDEAWVGGLGAAEVIPRSTDLASVGPVPVVLDAVPLGEAAEPAIKSGGLVVTTRPTPPIDPGREIRQQIQLIHLDRDVLATIPVGGCTVRSGLSITTTSSEARAASMRLRSSTPTAGCTSHCDR